MFLGRMILPRHIVETYFFLNVKVVRHDVPVVCQVLMSKLFQKRTGKLQLHEKCN